MSIWNKPPILQVATGADAYIEARMDLTCASLYEAIDLVLGDRSLPPRALAVGFHLVPVVETKLHRAKDDVEALQQSELWAGGFRLVEVPRADSYVAVAERVLTGQPQKVLKETGALLGVVRQPIEPDVQTVGRRKLRRALEPQSVLDELIVQEPVFAAPVMRRKSNRLPAVLAKHDAHTDLASNDVIHESIHHSHVLHEVLISDPGVLDLAREPQ